MKFLFYSFLFLMLIVLIFMICGCSTQKPIEVKIPLPVKNKQIAIPPKPDLPIWNLTNKSTPTDVIRAYVTSVQILNDDDDNLRMFLKAYQD